jgi:hypothetical protein
MTTFLDSRALPAHLRRARACVLLGVVSMAISAIVCSSLPAIARADGDPASDVLLAQPLFLPQDAGVSATGQAQLTSLLVSAHRRGFPARVAVIAGPTDLGSISALWRQPGNYARFLGQELSLNFRGPLLVVMPNGYGLYDQGPQSAREQQALGRLPAPGRGLGAAAVVAIQRLAASTGHPLPSPRGAAPTSHASGDTLAWAVFVVGAVLILLAWIASLRARPVRGLRGRPAS